MTKGAHASGGRAGGHVLQQGHGIYENGKLLASATEEIFAALKMEFIPPDRRER